MGRWRRMVSIMDAYSILNKSVLNVVNDMVLLDSVEFVDKPYQVRLDENSVSVSEVHNRLENTVVVGHNLAQYVNKFYSIFLDSSEVVMLDYLINVNPENIDLTEFGEFL
jgi:hypothetical protein